MHETKKLLRSKRTAGAILAFAGPSDFGEALVDWYEDGADPANYPECQKREDFATLLVAHAGEVRLYYQTPHAIYRLSSYGAIGGGAEVAIGAMAWGANADEAVMVAQKHCHSCGFGCDVEYF